MSNDKMADNRFVKYIAALGEAMHQELPGVSDSRAEFRVDGVPFQGNLVQAVQARDPAERDALLNLNMAIDQESKRLEMEQTDTVSDDALVDQIEKAIRDNPAEFPLLTKYYLNAQ